MRLRVSARMLATILISFVASLPTFAAGTSTTGPGSALSLMAASFSNGAPIGSVQLSGTISRSSGSSSDSGPITLTASADGSAKIGFQLSDGARTESQTAANATRTCQWSGPDGIVHDSSSSNCWPALVWFLPQISLQPGLISPSVSTSNALTQSTAAATVYVIQNQLITASVVKNPDAAAQIQNLSRTTLYIDAATLLPSVLDYEIQSDSGSTKIAVEIRYSNYQHFGGLVVPGHIERYLNGGLEFAIDVAQATVLN